MAPTLTAATIAKQVARRLLDDYDGFEVDGTDTGARVKPGTVQVEGFVEDGGYLSFLVTVSEVVIEDPEPSYSDDDDDDAETLAQIVNPPTGLAQTEATR